MELHGEMVTVASGRSEASRLTSPTAVGGANDVWLQFGALLEANQDATL